MKLKKTLEDVLPEALFSLALYVISSKTIPISFEKEKWKEVIICYENSILHEPTYDGCIYNTFPLELEKYNDNYKLDAEIKSIYGQNLDAFLGCTDRKIKICLSVRSRMFFLCSSCRNQYCKHCILL